MKNLIKILTYIIFFKLSLFSQSEITIQKGISLIGGEQNQEFTLFSKFYKQNYLIQVYKPKTPPPTNGYPVIYVLDGNATFPYASIMAQAIDNMSNRTKKTPPIIVSIGYTTQMLFDIKARSFDYTPPYEDELKQPNNRGSSSYAQGGAEQFYKFIQEQLKPIIEENYQINTKEQVLFGHSYGGLFTLYTFLNHSESFAYYMAASPSIWWNDFFILKEIKNQKIKIKNPTKLYLSVGEIENKGKNPSDIENFSSNLEDIENLKIKTFNISNATHIEALFPALNEAFKIYEK